MICLCLFQPLLPPFSAGSQLGFMVPQGRPPRGITQSKSWEAGSRDIASNTQGLLCDITMNLRLCISFQFLTYLARSSHIQCHFLGTSSLDLCAISSGPDMLFLRNFCWQNFYLVGKVSGLFLSPLRMGDTPGARVLCPATLTPPATQSLDTVET